MSVKLMRGVPVILTSLLALNCSEIARVLVMPPHQVKTELCLVQVCRVHYPLDLFIIWISIINWLLARVVQSRQDSSRDTPLSEVALLIVVNAS